jgi:hypothetical protein
MKKWLVLAGMLLISTQSSAVNYSDTIILLLNHLDISKEQMVKASEHGMQKYGWIVTKKSDTLLEGDLKGYGQSKVTMEAGDNAITLKYLTKEDMTDYKLYRRLLSIRTDTYLELLNCTSDTYRLNPAKSDKVRNLRAAVYAIAKFQWNISEISETKIVSSLPAKGRLEADITGETVRFRFWDEISGKYKEGNDNYTPRVNSLYQSQVVGCNAVSH